jgi:hypothetical protein
MNISWLPELSPNRISLLDPSCGDVLERSEDVAFIAGMG